MVPRLQTVNQKRMWMNIFGCLDISQLNLTTFLQCFIKVNKTWRHHDTSESRNSLNNGWKLVDVLQTRRKLFHQPERWWRGVFRRCRVVVLLEQLEKGKLINGDYYAAFLEQMNDAINVCKHSHLAKCFSIMTMYSLTLLQLDVAELHELRFELLWYVS